MSLREQIARIIDPAQWICKDQLDAIGGYSDFFVNESLEKADRIIAMMEARK